MAIQAHIHEQIKTEPILIEALGVRHIGGVDVGDDAFDFHTMLTARIL